MSLNTILATTPLVSTNYILKATGTTIGNSLIWDNGTNVGIGNSSPSYTLDVSGTGRFTGALTGAAASFGGNLSVIGNNFFTLTASNVSGRIGEYDATNRIAFTANQNSSDAQDDATKPSWGLVFNANSTDTAYIGHKAAGGGSAVLSSLMTITGAGNVGIGGTPVDLLTLNATSASTVFTLQNGAVTKALLGISYGASDLINNSAAGDLNIRSNNTNINFSIDNGSTLGMRIRSDGNIGIGVTGDANIKCWIKNDTSKTYALVVHDSSSNDLFVVRNDGVIYTGTQSGSPTNNTTANAVNMRVDGGGTLLRSTASSQRFKEEIKNWDASGLDTILALKPKTFKYKKDYYDKADVDFLGLIAEEVAEVSPYLADYENEDRTGLVENVRYANIVVPLIAAIKEMNTKFEEQQAQIQSLQEQINILAK